MAKAHIVSYIRSLSELIEAAFVGNEIKSNIVTRVGPEFRVKRTEPKRCFVVTFVRMFVVKILRRL